MKHSMHLIPPNPNLRLHHPMDCAILGLVLHHGHLPIQLLLQLPLLSPGLPHNRSFINWILAVTNKQAAPVDHPLPKQN